ncbi:protein-glutamine glutaminase family protein, partial [Actinoallomurus iriomotensis]|uniref:protein-glutamine glutaminase family protein n=1 Tax=Actinoallomurus iriomotensis TaxID=478107 RepID=UPI0025533820
MLNDAAREAHKGKASGAVFETVVKTVWDVPQKRAWAAWAQREGGQTWTPSVGLQARVPAGDQPSEEVLNDAAREAHAGKASGAVFETVVKTVWDVPQTRAWTAWAQREGGQTWTPSAGLQARVPAGDQPSEEVLNDAAREAHASKVASGAVFATVVKTVWDVPQTRAWAAWAQREGGQTWTPSAGLQARVPAGDQPSEEVLNDAAREAYAGKASGAVFETVVKTVWDVPPARAWTAWAQREGGQTWMPSAGLQARVPAGDQPSEEVLNDAAREAHKGKASGIVFETVVKTVWDVPQTRARAAWAQREGGQTWMPSAGLQARVPAGDQPSEEVLNDAAREAHAGKASGIVFETVVKTVWDVPRRRARTAWAQREGGQTWTPSVGLQARVPAGDQPSEEVLNDAAREAHAGKASGIVFETVVKTVWDVSRRQARKAWKHTASDPAGQAAATGATSAVHDRQPAPVEQALGRYGLVRVEVPADEDCYYTALIDTAGPDRLQNMTSPAQVRRHLAGQLRARPDLQAGMAGIVQRFLAEQAADQHIQTQTERYATDISQYQQMGLDSQQAAQAVAAHLPPTPSREDLIASLTRPVTGQDFQRIADQIETPRSWDNIGGAITPPLTALVFNLRINVFNNGDPYPIGEGQHQITLVNTGDHWDATQAVSVATQAEQVLAPHRLRRVPGLPGRYRFPAAFLHTAQAAGIPNTGVTAEQLLEVLATAVEDPRFLEGLPANLTDALYQAWAKEAGVAGGLDPDAPADTARWAPRIAEQIRAGSWAEQDRLVPHLIAHLYTIRIRVFSPDGTQEWIGDGTSTITLYRPTSHQWDATHALTEPLPASTNLTSASPTTQHHQPDPTPGNNPLGNNPVRDLGWDGWDPAGQTNAMNTEDVTAALTGGAWPQDAERLHSPPATSPALRLAAPHDVRDPVDEASRFGAPPAPADLEHAAPSAPRGLRPASNVATEDVYAFNPDEVRSWIHRVLDAAKASVGFYKWESNVWNFVHERGLLMSAVTNDGRTNDFIRWLRGEGSTPSMRSRMNCWQAFLYTAYWSGAVGREWLDRIHREAIEAGNDAYRTDRDEKRGFRAYFKSLARSMTSGEPRRHQVDQETGLTTPDLRAGHLVFINLDEHVVMALGTRDAQGRHEVLSHWDFPEAEPGRPYSTAGPNPGFLQRTTLEEVLAGFSGTPSVVSALPAWWTGPGPAARPEGVAEPIVERAAKVAEPAGKDWMDRRFTAPVVKVVTEPYDPKAAFKIDKDGTPHASAWEAQVRINVQRIQVTKDAWLRNHVVVRPVKPMFGVTDSEVAGVQKTLNRLLDKYANQGYELEVSKDEFFMAVKLVIDPDHPEAVELRPGRTADAPDLDLEGPDARHWGLGDYAVELLHELFHYMGLLDENRDDASQFRRLARSSAVKIDGIMSGGVFDPSEPMPPRYLRRIEANVDATAVLRDHPLNAPAPRGLAVARTPDTDDAAEAVASTSVYEVAGRDERPYFPAPPAPAPAPPVPEVVDPLAEDLPIRHNPAGTGTAPAQAEAAHPVTPSGDPGPVADGRTDDPAPAEDGGPHTWQPPADSTSVSEDPSAEGTGAAASADGTETIDPPASDARSAAGTDQSGIEAPGAAPAEAEAAHPVTPSGDPGPVADGRTDDTAGTGGTGASSSADSGHEPDLSLRGGELDRGSSMSSSLRDGWERMRGRLRGLSSASRVRALPQSPAVQPEGSRDLASESKRPERKNVRWADLEADGPGKAPAAVAGDQSEAAPAVAGDQGKAAPAVAGDQGKAVPAGAGNQGETATAGAGDQASSGPLFEDVIDQAQWHFTADGRPVLVALPGSADDGLVLDERTVALLARLVPPQTVFVTGQVSDPDMLVSLIAVRAAGHQPVLLMPGSGEIAGAIADATDGPVIAAPHGVIPDFKEGTLKAAGIGEASMRTDGQPGLGQFQLYLPGEPGQPIGPKLSVPADAAVAPVTVDPMARLVGVPRAGLPYMAELIRMVRQELAAQGVEVPEEEIRDLPQRLLSRYRNSKGLPVLLGKAELLVTYDLKDPQVVGPAGFETINSVYAIGAHAQMYSAQTEGIRAGFSGAFDVMGVARVGASVSLLFNGMNRTSTSIVDAEGGRVEDNRNDHTTMAYRPNISFKLRTKQKDGKTPRWEQIKPIRLRDTGTDKLLLWLAEPYLKKPSTDRVTAVGDGVKSDKLPPHSFVSDLTNLSTLFDEIIDTLASQGLELDPGDELRNQLWQKLENLPMNLVEGVNDEDWGYWFTLDDKKGKPRAVVQVHSERLQPGVRPVGATSDTAHLEDVRTKIQGNSGSHSVTNSTTITPLSIDGTIEPPAIPGLAMGPSLSVSLTSTDTETLSAGRVGLWVVVPRYAGQTAAYNMEFVHRAKAWVRNPKKKAGYRTETAPVPSAGLVRVTEPQAFEYGLPIDREALKEEERPTTGSTVPYKPDALITGPRPKDSDTEQAAPKDAKDAKAEQEEASKDAKAGKLPEYLYEGTGIGFGHVRVEQSTVDQIHAMLTSELRPMGFLPQKDDPFAGEHWFTHGNKVISGLDNQKLLDKIVSLRGFDSGYDQMLQEGMSFTLRKRRGTMRIDLDVDSVEVVIKARQRNAKYVGTTKEDPLVNLPMGMDNAAMSTAHSRRLAIAFKFKALFGYLKAALWSIEAGVGVGASDTVAFLNNQPDLLEHPGEAIEAELTNDYQVTLRFQHSGPTGEIAAGRRDRALPTLEGQKAIARVLPFDEAEEPSPREMSLRELLKTEKWTPAQVLDQGVPFHVDGTGLTKAAALMLEDLVGPAGAADQDVKAFAGLTMVRAHLREILNREYTTDRPLEEGLFRNTFGLLDISADLGPSRFVGATSDNFVLGIIKLLLLESRLTASSWRGVTTGPDFAAGDVAGEASLTGEAAGLRHLGWNTSRTTSRTGGVEYIQIDVKRAFIYLAPTTFTVKGRQEKHGKLFPSSETTHKPQRLDDRTVMYVLTEPEALKWYANGTLPVSDSELTKSLTGWRDGDLRLTGDVVAGILTRWYEDLKDRPRRKHKEEEEFVTGLARDLAKMHGRGALRVIDPVARARFAKVFGRPLAEPPGTDRLVDMPKDLVEYARGERTLPDRRLAEAMTAWQAGELALTGDVAADVLRRWATEVPTLPADAPPVDRSALATTLAGWHTQEISPIRDEAAREAFNATFGKKLPEPPLPFDELRPPENLTRKDPGGRFLGQSGIRSFTHENGESTYQILKKLIDEVAPGLLSAGAEIWDRKGRVVGRMQGGVDALQGMLAKRRDQPWIDEFLTENGYSFYLVNPMGWLLSDVVEVNVALALGDPEVRDFEPGTANEVYLHGYQGRAKATSRDESLSITFAKFSAGGGEGVSGGGSGGLKGSLGNHRGTTRAQSGVDEQTAFSSDRYIIGFSTALTATARHLRRGHAPLNNWLMKKFDQWTHHSATGTVTQNGELEIQLPRALAESGSVDTAHPRPDFTPLPEVGGKSFIDGVVFDDAVQIGRDLLSRMFSPGAAARLFEAMAEDADTADEDADTTAGDADTTSSRSLPTLLSRMHLRGNLWRATGGNVYTLSKDIFDPGDDSKRAELSLIGDLTGLEVIAPLEKDAGIGRYNKYQIGTTTSASTDHMRMEADVSFNMGMPIHHPIDSFNPATNSGRTTAANDASAGTENNRDEQHGKEKNPLYLVRVRFHGRLIGDLFKKHRIGKSKKKGRYYSEPINGEVQLKLYQADLDEMRAKMAEETAKIRPTLEPWPAMDGAPRFDLAPLLAQAARDGREAGRAYQGVVRHIRRETGGDRPVVLTVDERALATRTYEAVLAWGLRTMRDDVTAARELYPALGTPSALQRYERPPQAPGGSAEAVDDATTEIIKAVNEVHALRPDNPTGAPAALPPEAAAWRLSPVDVGRDVAHALGAHVRVDVDRSDGTLRRTWISPNGRIYFFDPATAIWRPRTRGAALWVIEKTTSREHRVFSSAMAVRQGLAPPELRAELNLYGLDYQQMGRLYVDAQVRQQTFEQAVRVELRDRARRLSEQHPVLPVLLSRAADAHAHWQNEEDRLKRRQLPPGDASATAVSLSEARDNVETARRLLDDLRAVARGGPGAPAWNAQDVRSAAAGVDRLDGLGLPARLDEPPAQVVDGEQPETGTSSDVHVQPADAGASGTESVPGSFDRLAKAYEIGTWKKGKVRAALGFPPRLGNGRATELLALQAEVYGRIDLGRTDQLLALYRLADLVHSLNHRASREGPLGLESFDTLNPALGSDAGSDRAANVRALRVAALNADLTPKGRLTLSALRRAYWISAQPSVGTEAMVELRREARAAQNRTRQDLLDGRPHHTVSPMDTPEETLRGLETVVEAVRAEYADVIMGQPREGGALPEFQRAHLLPAVNRTLDPAATEVTLDHAKALAQAARALWGQGREVTVSNLETMLAPERDRHTWARNLVQQAGERVAAEGRKPWTVEFRARVINLRASNRLRLHKVTSDAVALQQLLDGSVSLGHRTRMADLYLLGRLLRDGRQDGADPLPPLQAADIQRVAGDVFGAASPADVTEAATKLIKLIRNAGMPTLAAVKAAQAIDSAPEVNPWRRFRMVGWKGLMPGGSRRARDVFALNRELNSKVIVVSNSVEVTVSSSAERPAARSAELEAALYVAPTGGYSAEVSAAEPNAISYASLSALLDALRVSEPGLRPHGDPVQLGDFEGLSQAVLRQPATVENVRRLAVLAGKAAERGPVTPAALRTVAALDDALQANTGQEVASSVPAADIHALAPASVEPVPPWYYPVTSTAEEPTTTEPPARKKKVRRAGEVEGGKSVQATGSEHGDLKADEAGDPALEGQRSGSARVLPEGAPTITSAFPARVDGSTGTGTAVGPDDDDMRILPVEAGGEPYRYGSGDDWADAQILAELGLNQGGLRDLLQEVNLSLGRHNRHGEQLDVRRVVEEYGRQRSRIGNSTLLRTVADRIVEILLGGEPGGLRGGGSGGEKEQSGSAASAGLSPRPGLTPVAAGTGVESSGQAGTRPRPGGGLSPAEGSGGSAVAEGSASSTAGVRPPVVSAQTLREVLARGIPDVFGRDRPEPASFEQVRRWYELLTAMRFDHPELGPVPVPHEYLDDGCYARAHLGVLQLLGWGAPAGKIMVSQVTPDGDGGLGPLTLKDPIWGYHIAAVVWAYNAMGRPEWFVLDPALGLGPLTVGEWLIRIRVDPRNPRNLFLTGTLDDVQAALWQSYESDPEAWFRDEEDEEDEDDDRLPFPRGWAVTAITEGHADSHPMLRPESSLRGLTERLRRAIENRIVAHAMRAREFHYVQHAKRILQELQSAGAPPEEAVSRLRAELPGPSPMPNTLQRYEEDELVELLDDVFADHYDELTEELFPEAEGGVRPPWNELSDTLARTSMYANTARVSELSEANAEEPVVPSPPQDWPQWTSAPHAESEVSGDESTGDEMSVDRSDSEGSEAGPSAGGGLTLGGGPVGLRGRAPDGDLGSVGSGVLITGPREGDLSVLARDDALALEAGAAGKAAVSWFVHGRLEDSRSAVYRVSSDGWFEFSDGLRLSPEGWVRIGADGADFVHMPEGVVLRADTAVVARVSNTVQLGQMLAKQRFDAVSYTLVRGPAGLYLVPPVGVGHGQVVAVSLPEVSLRPVGGVGDGFGEALVESLRAAGVEGAPGTVEALYEWVSSNATEAEMPDPEVLGRFRELVAGEGRGSVNVNPVTAMVVGWRLIPVTVVDAGGVRRYGLDVPVGVLVVEEEGRFLAAVRAAGESGDARSSAAVRRESSGAGSAVADVDGVGFVGAEGSPGFEDPYWGDLYGDVDLSSPNADALMDWEPGFGFPGAGSGAGVEVGGRSGGSPGGLGEGAPDAGSGFVGGSGVKDVAAGRGRSESVVDSEAEEVATASGGVVDGEVDYGDGYQMRAAEVEPDPDSPPDSIPPGSPSPEAAPAAPTRARDEGDRLARVQGRVRDAGGKGLTIGAVAHAYDSVNYDSARFAVPDALGDGFRLVGARWYAAKDAPVAPTRPRRAPQARNEGDRLARVQGRVRDAGGKGLAISAVADIYNSSKKRENHARFAEPGALGDGFSLVGDRWYAAEAAPAAPARAPRAGNEGDRLARVQGRVRDAGGKGLTISDVAIAYDSHNYDHARFAVPGALGDGFSTDGVRWYAAEAAPAAPTQAVGDWPGSGEASSSVGGGLRGGAPDGDLGSVGSGVLITGPREGDLSVLARDALAFEAGAAGEPGDARSSAAVRQEPSGAGSAVADFDGVGFVGAEGSLEFEDSWWGDLYGDVDLSTPNGDDLWPGMDWEPAEGSGSPGVGEYLRPPLAGGLGDLLAYYRLRQVLVARDGECFFNALGVTAGPDLLGGLSTAWQIRDTLANAVFDPAVVAQLPVHWQERLATNEDRVRIAGQIRQDWANEGGDLVPYLAAARFNVQIRMLHHRHDGSAVVEMIGDDAAPTITLIRPLNHWDATEPLPPPAPSGQPGHSGWPSGYGPSGGQHGPGPHSQPGGGTGMPSASDPTFWHGGQPDGYTGQTSHASFRAGPAAESAEDAMSLDGSEEGSSSASSGDGELLLGATRGGLRGGAPGGGL